MTREELIEALEKADGPSKQLDFNIANFLGLVPNHSIREVGFDYDWYRSPGNFTLWKAMDSEGRKIQSWSAKLYTSSIDAALTLVPDGWILYLYQSVCGTWWDAELTTIEGSVLGDITTETEQGCPSPAIALCIAALKAMEQSDDAA